MRTTSFNATLRLFLVTNAVVGCSASSTDPGTASHDAAETSDHTTESGDAGSVLDDCARYCMNVAALGCPGDIPGRCESRCTELNAMTSCEVELSAFMACAANAPLECREIGAVVLGCHAQGLAYRMCGLATLDGGQSD